MEDIESKIQSVLSDPAQMAQIMQMAEGLGLRPKENPEAPAMPTAAPTSTRQTALLNALIPYLPPNKQRRLARALKIGQLSKVAGFALLQSKETE